jgi:hypothetical protein
MVSNASDDLPEPESPVNAIILFLGISTVMFLRLWVRAPLTMSFSSVLSLLLSIFPSFNSQA